MYNDVVLHKHKGVIRFTDYGAGANVAASRSLFLGEQAGGVAFGSPGTGCASTGTRKPATTATRWSSRPTDLRREEDHVQFGLTTA
jgi:hypothetical protein